MKRLSRSGRLGNSSRSSNSSNLSRSSKLNKIFAKSMPNTYKCKFKVSSNFLSTSFHGKEYFYKILSVEPNGINILDESDNGTEIKHLIHWTNIK